MNILFFVHPGRNSRGVLMDVIGGFRKLGHNTILWECGDVMRLLQAYPEQRAGIHAQVMRGVSDIIRKQDISLSVGMWANGLSLVENPQVNGRVQTFFESLCSPHLLLWYDSPERAHSEALRSDFRIGTFKSPYLFHYINNSDTAREMERIYQFSNVLPRGYGINPEVFKPDPSVPRDFDLVFCASFGDMPSPPQSVLDELAKDEPDSRVLRAEAARLHWPVFGKLVAQFPEGMGDDRTAFLRRLHQSQLEYRDVPLMDRVNDLVQQPGDIGAAAKLMLADGAIYANVGTELRKLDLYEREFVFTYLSRYFKCRLFGPVDYRSLGCNVTTDGAVEYEAQRRIYQSAHVGLSVMRWQDERGLHVKPYEMCACGIPCIAQYRPGIEDHYRVGEEIEVFHSFAEARDKIANLIADPQRRALVAQRGYERTVRDHTWACWADEMIGQIKSRLPSHFQRHAA